jgi:tetratricopeptide (TPR) repeat protein
MHTFLQIAALLLSACASAETPETVELAKPDSFDSTESPDAISQLVDTGRHALAAGHTAEARERFERALTLSGNDAGLRIWVLRTEIEEGRFEEVLLSAEEIAEEGGPDADVDYLVGLASFRTARATIDAGNPDATTSNYLLDGQHLLASALAVDAERYDDAWPALTEAAWRNGDLDEAERAASEALSRAPQDADLHALLGRISFGRYQQLREEGGAEAQEAWSQARSSFERYIALHENAPAQESAVADAWMQLGHLHAWAQDSDAAAKAYTQAITADPSSVDFAQIQGALDAPRFAEVTSAAVQRFGELHPQGDVRQATLYWWDGSSHWRIDDWERAASSFRSAVALWPAYSASWYWVHRAEFERKQYGESLEALRSFARDDRPALVALLSQDPPAEAPRLEWLVGTCADPGQTGGRARNADAAFLCELLTEIQPEESRHWNNLGLFLRDEGEVLGFRGGDSAASQELWNRSLAAYERSLELEPENPNYMNDTAVMLHYYLKRDLDRAREMYLEATCLAEAELARTDLSEETRDLVQIALRDSKNNVQFLDSWRERVASGEKDLDPRGVR